MRGITFRPDRDAERFATEEVAAPTPGPGQLLVRTEVVGVSLGLVRMLAAGEVPPAGPGGEIVGRVEALGPGTTTFRLGERVGGVAFGGVYAESVIAQTGLVTRVPEDVDTRDALALVRGGLVALCALRAGRFASGESVLVNAAASGTGHLAVQLARALGADRVVAAVGTSRKADFARECGADEVVTYAAESWGDPVDLVLDGVGGDHVRRGVEALADHGRLVALSAAGGQVDTNSLLAGHRAVMGFSMGLVSRQQPEVIEHRRAELWDLLAAGRLRPAHVEFPLGRLAEAVALVSSRANLGRVLVRTL